ncbi:MAG: M28 family peptidase [Candidatus Njordarchaeum guaymaensis]
MIDVRKFVICFFIILAIHTTFIFPNTLICYRSSILVSNRELSFNKDVAWSHLENYSHYSPIIPNSTNNKLFLRYARKYFEHIGWRVEFQNWTHDNNVNLHNLIAKSPEKGENIIILGAHYDNRVYADKDPDPQKRVLPVPGINDGGSGTAVLLELARVLDIPPFFEVWIVLFDAEDQGGIPGWSGGISGWCIGSTYFVNSLNSTILSQIKLSIILDIVGGKNLTIQKESYSTPSLIDQIWNVAKSLGMDNIFVDETGISVIDDHLPFIRKGIPAVDIIQQKDQYGFTFFRWHHTTNDTLQNCDKNSLYSVGIVIENFIEKVNVSDIKFEENPTWSFYFIVIFPFTLIFTVYCITRLFFDKDIEIANRKISKSN